MLKLYLKLEWNKIQIGTASLEPQLNTHSRFASGPLKVSFFAAEKHLVVEWNPVIHKNRRETCSDWLSTASRSHWQCSDSYWSITWMTWLTSQWAWLTVLSRCSWKSKRSHWENFSRVKLRQSAILLVLSKAVCFSLGFIKALFFQKQRIKPPLGEYILHAAPAFYCLIMTRCKFHLLRLFL